MDLLDGIYERLRRGEAWLSVVGLGYVGMPLALAFAEHLKVIGFDVNTNTKDSLTEVVRKYDKCVFVFGSEGEGMRELTKKSCDVLLRLPMRAGAESLNVANTASIVGWEWFGKR